LIYAFGSAVNNVVAHAVAFNYRRFYRITCIGYFLVKGRSMSGCHCFPRGEQI